ncbi:hypothetical protein SELMODRAFT_413655 [Selaginella moellendorffii]|uniref:Bifunctional inhibitor/plant lipid transfer protein/seed storage helical domain-containing protein n=1 Tax=Selaginella moellendorffii TaxID=88036 RepID=D8RPS8_SELML|nr:hypothetical protein SELMODRAFT_413655 [Selaginella moellendorffii]
MPRRGMLVLALLLALDLLHPTAAQREPAKCASSDAGSVLMPCFAMLCHAFLEQQSREPSARCCSAVANSTQKEPPRCLCVFLDQLARAMNRTQPLQLPSLCGDARPERCKDAVAPALAPTPAGALVPGPLHSGGSFMPVTSPWNVLGIVLVLLSI